MRAPAWLVRPVILLFSAGVASAGGSGLNVIVVVNQNSTNSVQLGNAYCEQRGVPPQNVFRMTGWTGGAIQWNRSDFETQLRDPLLSMMVSRGLTSQAQFVLLSMDIPYRVQDGDSYNSTTSALYYGFKTNTASPVPGYPTCSLPDYSSNSYAFSELPLGEAPPDTAPTNSLLAMMLTDASLAGAELILSRGVASDSSFPPQSVYLAKTTDMSRNIRFVEFDDAVFECRVRGDSSLIRIDGDSTSFTNVLGLMTGLPNLSLPANAFVDGGIGDSLTSFGGYLFENTGQTPLLVFLDAGAAGSYGTVIEPCNYLEKFPSPLDYFYQCRGFSIAESYYQSVRNPFQGLLVGEPLSAPFALRAGADWSSLTNGSVLSGQATLTLTFFAAATNLPLSRVDLFIDGTYFSTVTNLPPSAGNLLSVMLNGIPISYTVPANATVASATAGLAAALNALTNVTRVMAYPIGDRLALLSLDLTNPAGNVTLSANATIGSALRLTTLATPARPACLDTTAVGYLGLLVSNAPAVGDWVQLDLIKTNGTPVAVSVTNLSSGTSVGTLLQSLISRINSNPLLQSADGLSAADLYDYGLQAFFTVYARSPGWPAAQIQVALSASTNLLALPSGTNPLEDNLTDLQPRNHLYVSAGLTSLPVNFTLDTTQLPDGFHELAMVAYEGTSVRAQTRIPRSVLIRNSSLSATLTPSVAGTNAALDQPLQFTVAANTPNIQRIELFSTGGSLAAVAGQQTAVFLAPAATLGLGLHPFYAVVTGTPGNQYRTQTVWIRLVPSFRVSISGPPFVLSWPAITGQRYDVLATTNLAAGFQSVTSFVASAPTVQWPVSTSAGSAAFYRVRLSP